MKLKFLSVLIISAMFVGCGGGGSSTSDVIKGADIKQKDVEKAFVNKTFYTAEKDCDGTINLGTIKFGTETFTYSDNEGSETIAYTIKDNYILLDGNEKHIISEIKTNKYVKEHKENNENINTLYYNKDDALANPEVHHCD